MSFELLSLHRHRFQVGKPTPFGIFDGGARLLLARGHALESEEQLDRLVDRDATVDMREVDDTVRKIANARPEQLPAFWDESMGAIGRVLRANPGADFTRSLDQASRSLTALIERDPDLAILQAVRGETGGSHAMYASRHAVHTATAASLAATRLGWPAERGRCVLRAALTMNISMAELQNRLANQVTPLTPLQRAEINSHPERSANMLELAGVTDTEWLDAVRQHHENESGSGYPAGLTKINEVAQLVQCADTFTAKLSQRALRQPMLADKAARQQFQSSSGNAMTAALIKEFGLYPPGCAVRLKNGEVGVVMRRGGAVSAPVVAAVADGSGDPLLTPGRRDTSKPGLGIAAVIPMSALKVRFALEKLIISTPE
jgi:HD-GYP domain-containing protein (c-di-GMP phosphodiesterase class II)